MEKILNSPADPTMAQPCKKPRRGAAKRRASPTRRSTRGGSKRQSISAVSPVGEPVGFGLPAVAPEVDPPPAKARAAAAAEAVGGEDVLSPLTAARRVLLLLCRPFSFALWQRYRCCPMFSRSYVVLRACSLASVENRWWELSMKGSARCDDKTVLSLWSDAAATATFSCQVTGTSAGDQRPRGTTHWFTS